MCQFQSISILFLKIHLINIKNWLLREQVIRAFVASKNMLKQTKNQFQKQILESLPDSIQKEWFKYFNTAYT